MTPAERARVDLLQDEIERVLDLADCYDAREPEWWALHHRIETLMCEVDRLIFGSCGRCDLGLPHKVAP